ncbi:hypothetical protein AB0K00_53600 [Dactylosporangium sp. NPDC049525]|uniref:hypothetical protein n=1 Tax=Dactylosporangium sp. NPDC049525 TaxID=3154730 RepID=UPI0034413F3F
MQMIDDLGDALAVLHDPGFVVPPVPAATHGVAWLRATVGRFSDGESHTRRRALSEALLSTVDPKALRAAASSSPHAHPVQHLAAALGLDSSAGTIDAVRVVAAAYQPGTGDETAADVAVRTLVDTFGGTPDESTAARIGLLVQACDATATLIDRARAAGLEAALRDTPPVPATKRLATRPTALGNTRVEAGEVVRVSLHGIPFGAGPRSCPGRTHALALAEGALTATFDPDGSVVADAGGPVVAAAGGSMVTGDGGPVVVGGSVVAAAGGSVVTGVGGSVVADAGGLAVADVGGPVVAGGGRAVGGSAVAGPISGSVAAGSGDAQ